MTSIKFYRVRSLVCSLNLCRRALKLESTAGKACCRVLKGGGFADVGQVLLMDGWRVGDAALNLFRSISTGIIIIVNAGVALFISTTLAAYALLGIGVLMLVFGSRFRVSRARGGRITAIQDEI